MAGEVKILLEEPVELVEGQMELLEEQVLVVQVVEVLERR